MLAGVPVFLFFFVGPISMEWTIGSDRNEASFAN